MFGVAFCVQLTCKSIQSFLEGVYNSYCVSAIDRPPFNAEVMVIYSPKTIFKSIFTKSPQKFKAFKLKYLGTLEAINLVAATIQYELA